MADRSPRSDDSEAGARDNNTGGLALAPTQKRPPTAQLAYAIIDGRVTEVQVATAADLAAAAAAANAAAAAAAADEDMPVDVDEDVNGDDDNDGDDSSMEVGT